MISYSGRFNVFAVFRLWDYLDNEENKLKQYINTESDNFILKVNETEYYQSLLDKFQLEPLKLYLKEYIVKKEEETRFHKKRYVLNIPLKGDKQLLKYQPEEYMINSFEGYINENMLCCELNNTDSKGMTIEIKRIMDYLEFMEKTSETQVKQYNEHIKNLAKNYFDFKKKSILEEIKSLEEAGIPLVTDEEIKTFTVPQIEFKEPLKIEPSQINNNILEPTLNNKNYNQILEHIQSMGIAFEQHPANYKDKCEEDLRDHILTILIPNIKDSSITSESFNKKGKTDILIKYENTNIFVAECKIWYGQKQYLEAITQLLTYLTWRDSKSAVILFVPNQNISEVINKIKEVTPTHSNFLREEKEKDDSWLNYTFHLNSDKGKEVKIAILIFHIPKE